MNCPKCALDNPPYEANCDACGTPIQSVEEAKGRRGEWNSLSSRNREELQERYLKARQRYDNYQSWRKKNKILHTVVGAITVTVCMNFALLFPNWWTLTSAPLFGAAAGYYLNHIGGGMWKGFGLFVAASAIVALPYFGAAWTLASLGFIASGGVGYYLGLRLDFSRVEQLFS
jgi:hypothetical protein